MKTLKICLFALIGMIATQSCKNFHSKGSAKAKEAEEVTKSVERGDIKIEQADKIARQQTQESRKDKLELDIKASDNFYHHNSPNAGAYLEGVYTHDMEAPPAPEKVDELPIDENKKDVFTSTFFYRCG